MTQRVAVVTGTRADFGLWLPVLRELADRGGAFEPGLLVMGMHLDERFGSTVDEVRASGFPVIAEIAATPEADTAAAMAASIAPALEGAAEALDRSRPDWLLVLGDRGEQLAAALAGLHLGTAIAHLHGGERTAGAVDDTLRDLVSRMAHLHFVAGEGPRQRLLAMGEAAWRVQVTGGPGIDAIRQLQPTAPGPELRARYGLAADEPYLVSIIHPETATGSTPPEVLSAAVLEGLASCDLSVVAIWPNADAGGRAIAARLGSASSRLAALVPSVPHAEYLDLLAGASAIVGNSSSGIIEAPFLRVPAVNVGERQSGRERGDNVIDVPVASRAVSEAIRRATAPDFRAGLSGRSPYGDGYAAPRIVDALTETPIDETLLRKLVP
jgi:GDP/UDP-N,N'-diacetylbacillosamine 2-epimerase (hydrolysing)